MGVNGRAKGSKKKRTCRRADGERKKDEHLKLLTMLCTILIYINYKTLFKNGNVAIFSNNPSFQLLTSN